MAGLEETEEKCKGVMAPNNSSTVGKRNGNETAGHISSEDRDTVIAIEGEHESEGD